MNVMGRRMMEKTGKKSLKIVKNCELNENGLKHDPSGVWKHS
jgi:hypothetical protein